MLDVYLTREESAFAADVARRINANKAKHGLAFQSWKDDVDEFTSRNWAMRSELAVAKVLGLPWNPAILKGGDGKIDFYLDKPTSVGQTLQVKYRSERGRDLATENLDFRSQLLADVYILAWPTEDGEGITLVGWIDLDDWLWHIAYGDPPVRMARGRKKYALTPDKLRPIEELVEKINGTTTDRRLGESIRREDDADRCRLDEAVLAAD